MDDRQESRITNVNLGETMRKSFLEYAMSVIVARALPDVRDGLKPVQRRIRGHTGEAIQEECADRRGCHGEVPSAW